MRRKEARRMRRRQADMVLGIFLFILVIGLLVGMGWYIGHIGTLEWMLAERDDLRRRLDYTEKRIAIRKAELQKEMAR